MVLLIRIIAAATLLTGCFSPALDGKFHCSDEGSCPPGLSCAKDDVCRDEAVDAGVTHDLAARDLATHDLATRDLAGPCVKKTTCTPGACGDALDGCGGKLSCGGCAPPANMCGGAGANLCGNIMCKPTSCKMKGVDCGLISDGCAAVLDCGSCSDGKACGGDNQCS